MTFHEKDPLDALNPLQHHGVTRSAGARVGVPLRAPGRGAREHGPDQGRGAAVGAGPPEGRRAPPGRPPGGRRPPVPRSGLASDRPAHGRGLPEPGRRRGPGRGPPHRRSVGPALLRRPRGARPRRHPRGGDGRPAQRAGHRRPAHGHPAGHPPGAGAARGHRLGAPRDPRGGRGRGGPGRGGARGRRRSRHRPRQHGRSGAGGPLRQLGHHPRGGGGRLRHPLRAPGAPDDRALPRGRGAAPGDRRPEPHLGGRGQPDQDHGRPRHRRAADAPGRPHRAHHRRPLDRPARGLPAHRARREGRHPGAGQEQRAPPARRARLHARGAGALRALLPAPLRRRAGHRAHRLGQVHHPLRHPEPDQHRGAQHHHGGGPGRVPDGRGQPDAGEPQGRPDLRLGPALDPAVRPRRDHDRRDPRPRDGPDRRGVGAHGPPRAGHAPHQRRRRRAHPAHRDGRGGLPLVQRRRRRARAAARAAPVQRLPPGGLDLARGPAARGARSEPAPRPARPRPDLHARWAATAAGAPATGGASASTRCWS